MPRRILLIILLILVTVPLAAANPKAAANAARFHVFTLLPPLLAIVLAFLTRNVIVSLFTGVLAGSFILLTTDATLLSILPRTLIDVADRARKAIAGSWNAGILLQVLTIGGLIALMQQSGGLRAFAEKIAARARSPISAQIAAWLLGFTVFFDDYANALIIGPSMRPVTDRMRVSREKLSFIVDATAAPVAGMALISTWVAYELGLLQDAFGTIGSTIPAYEVFIRTLPYRFYNILILLFIPATILLRREFGPMLTAERRTRETGEVLRPGARPLQGDTTTGEAPSGGSIWLMLAPVLVLVLSAFIGFWHDGYTAIMKGKDMVSASLVSGNPLSFTSIRMCFGKASADIVLFQSALLASLTALGMWTWGIRRKLSEGITIWLGGARSMIMTGVVLVLAWSLSGLMKELGTAVWLSGILGGSLPPALLPALIFLLGAVISFATGTSYGTMGILMPLAVPLAAQLGKGDPQLPILAAGAVLTGAIFGDHCSPISDTTILSSTGAGSDHMDHTRTQLPYALTVAAVSLFLGFIPAGFGISPWILLPVSTAALVLIVRFLGKKVE